MNIKHNNMLKNVTQHCLFSGTENYNHSQVYKVIHFSL